MLERQRRASSNPSGYISGKMANDLSPRKTMVVLVIVVGCFAVLWPKVFYPMLLGSMDRNIKPSPIDGTKGCCDVISEMDVHTLKIMSHICSTIVKPNREDGAPLSNQALLSECRSTVLDVCGIDLSAVLHQQIQIGQTSRQILDQVRSLNGSLCLKYNFGVAPWSLGVPHRVIVKMSPSSIKQERPLHLRSEMVHPAFRERGRAIPQSQPQEKAASPSRSVPKVIVPGRPGPIPGMRPTLGGAGHVVPAPKQGGGSMGLIMPIYTIGIIIFFTYTVMKLLFKKQPESSYPPVNADATFRKEVFDSAKQRFRPRVENDGVSTKLGWKERDTIVNAMSALLDEVDQEISARQKVNEVTDQDVGANGKIVNREDASVKILGMETTASCEGGKKWSRPDSPVLEAHPHSTEVVEPPQEIILEGSLPPQSHLLVTDSATEAQNLNSEEDPAVVLAGKMTLSVISLDSSDNISDESSNGEKHGDRSSSNASEDFEKIENESVIEETQNIDVKLSLLEEIRDEINQNRGVNSQKIWNEPPNTEVMSVEIENNTDETKLELEINVAEINMNEGIDISNSVVNEIPISSTDDSKDILSNYDEYTSDQNIQNTAEANGAEDADSGSEEEVEEEEEIEENNKEIEYETEEGDNDDVNEEIRNVGRIGEQDERTQDVNGRDFDNSINGTASNVTLAESDISDDEISGNEDDEEIIEEIIEYVTDEEDAELIKNNVDHDN